MHLPASSMGLHGCGKCIKITMFIANMLILAGGIAVLAVGIWTCVDKGYLEELLGNDLYMSSAYILIAMGSTIIVISFIGCLGAIREIKCLLLTYFIILFLIFVILLIGGILGYVFKNKVQDTTNTAMLSSLMEDYDRKEHVKESWDTLQERMKCCGMVTDGIKIGYEAWRKNKQFMGQDPPFVPLSCCLRSEDGEFINKDECQKLPPSNTTVYSADCYHSTLDFVQGHALILGGVGVGISCLMVIGMIFACVLFKLIE